MLRGEGLEMDGRVEARDWLRANRCPDCAYRSQAACVYKVDRTLTGWRCRGFKSKWTNERLDAAWFRRRKS